MKNLEKIITVLLLVGIMVVVYLLINNFQRDIKMRTAFNDILSINDLNKSIRIKLDPLISNRNLISRIEVEVQNCSFNNILIPLRTGIHLYILENGKWMEIKNNVIVYGEGDGPILEPNAPDNLGNITFIPIRPELHFIKGGEPEDIDSIRFIRVVVIGKYYSDDTLEEITVAAYKDLRLKP